ncbi:MAG: N-acetylmuramoyl-L-alanine amidase [bacterium]|nr:N-acetylmuramoyl-L-alanine amidase [bacterium]
MRSILFLALLFLSFTSNAQVTFQSIYADHPLLPHGVLEGVAWTNTRMQHLQNQAPSCSGYPNAYGIMGLHDNGKSYFIENGQVVANLSGISIAQQKSDPQLQVEAYAIALESILAQTNNSLDPSNIAASLMQLSEIPDTGIVNILAREMQVYEVLRFMKDPKQAETFGFTAHHYNLATVFGEDHYDILSAKKITLTETSITNENGAEFVINANATLQYGPAIWNPAPSCNFSSRNGVAVSAITIHTIQGSYAGAISWSQNCNSNVSFHYVIRSSDGQVTQMVLEEDKGWHVGSENPYTIGYEHEGYVNDPSWYTDAMYNSSSDLSKDIINSGYGIPSLRTYFGPSSTTVDVLGGCTKIKGHQHYPNQTHTDPGINWDWERYYRLINDNPTYTTVTNTSSTLYDSGGSTGPYSDDERLFWLIQPPNTDYITLDFNVFDIELDWDYLFVYDGDSINDPLIGQFTGTTIPQITSSGGSLLLEFRSDCATTTPGWEASYTSVPLDNVPPQSSVVAGNLWQTDDFTVDFVDTDNQSGVSNRYYLVSEKEIAENAPKSKGSYGFVNESFADGSALWTNQTGSFTINSGEYVLDDTTEQNSNAYTLVEQNANQSYLYSWNQMIAGTASNQRAGLHFFCDDATLPNRGNSYFVYLRASDLVQIYSVENDVFTLQENIPFTIDTDVMYECKVQYDPSTGWIRVFVNDMFVGEWQDQTPLTSGNAISLRSGGCAIHFDDVRVYQSRGSQVAITAGFGELLSIESEGAVPTGYVYATAIDSTDNWSTIDEETYLLDFSLPELLSLNDGVGNDIDTVTTATLEANWSAQDIHSDIANYEVAIGTLPNLDDVVGWTANGLTETFSQLIGSPVYNEVYHISIRVTNGAGLVETFISDGQRYIDDLGIETQDWNSVNVYPNPSSDIIQIEGLKKEFTVVLFDAAGKKCLEQTISSGEPVSIASLASGTYQLVIQSGSEFVVRKLIKN